MSLQQQLTRLIREPAVLAHCGFKTTTLYEKIKKGEFTPPIKLTERSSAWLESEMVAINAAIIAGKPKEEIKALVRGLVAARLTLPARVEAMTAHTTLPAREARRR